MYDELIEELRRHHCDAKEDDTQEVCDECAYDVIIADESVPSGIASVCVCGLMNRAADAIEALTEENERLRKAVADRIRAMSDEELAAWIETFAPSGAFQFWLNGKTWLQWLRQEAGRDGRAD